MLLSKMDLPPHSFRESAARPGQCSSCPLPQRHSIHPSVSRLRELDGPGTFDGEDDTELVNGEAPTGVMIALFPDEATAKALKVPGGEKARSLHVTLAYLGDAENVGDPATLLLAVQDFANRAPMLDGEISGVGVFTAGDGGVTYASVDLPELPAFREDLVRTIERAGFFPARNHGFTPHMTLTYSDKRDLEVPNLPLHFDSVTVAIRGKMTSFPLRYDLTAMLDDSTVVEPAEIAADDSKAKGQLVKGKGTDDEHKYKGIDGVDDDGVLPPCQECKREKDDPIHGGDGVGDLVRVDQLVHTEPRIGPKTLGPELSVVDAPLSKAFVTEVDGKTIITAQAATLTSWEKALNPNPHMMWVQGKFVGGEKANRNGAYWSLGDLEMGEPTVKYGPLNWLHEAHHIIGMIADSRLQTAGAGEKGDEPYIEAAAGIWQWVWPDEAYVVEQASDAGKLWYSMECISNKVECIGDNGCGETAGYFDYMKGAGCIHMQQRSSDRRFVDPIFLGGAVIVPPVRPGWGEADAMVIQQAKLDAERAFEQAGQPDVSASDWEQMMAMVIGWAKL